MNAPVLDETGRILFGGMDRPLLDMDSGRELWKPGRYERGYPAPNRNHFIVREYWSRIWNANSKDRRFDTDAYRRFTTARLDYRIAVAENYHPSRNNHSDTLTITGDGNVHQLPLLVNWPLLALCQAILATPLVLLWAILRWRRNRRVRLSVQP
jgi:hypothetical protein